MPMAFIATEVISPTILFGTSPHHAQMSGPDGTAYTATYCNRSEIDKTMSEVYDLYYKGSLIDSLARYCTESDGRDTTVAVAGSATLPSTTVSALYELVCDLGRGFNELGLSPGDRALLYTDETDVATTGGDASTYEAFLSCFGLWCQGMHVVVAGSAAGLETALRETSVRVLITSSSKASAACAALRAANVDRPHIVVLSNTTPQEADSLPTLDVPFTRFGDVLTLGHRCRKEHQRTLPRPEPDNVAMIVYPSYAPHQGIVLSHGNLHAGITVTTPRLASLTGTAGIRTSVVEPLSHITPLIVASACLLSGGTIAFGQTAPEDFQPTIVACSQHSMTSANKVLGASASTAFILQYALPTNEKDLASRLTSQSGSTSSILSEEAIAYWYSPVVASGVGLMRSTDATVTLLPGIELRLRLVEGNTKAVTVEEGQRYGEIMLKGPCVSKGLFTPDEGLGGLNRSVLVDGWYPTGDVAVVGATGEMRIVGRLQTHEST